MLQEKWLPSYKLNELFGRHSNFYAAGISSVIDTERIHVGSLYGGSYGENLEMPVG